MTKAKQVLQAIAPYLRTMTKEEKRELEGTVKAVLGKKKKEVTPIESAATAAMRWYNDEYMALYGAVSYDSGQWRNIHRNTIECLKASGFDEDQTKAKMDFVRRGRLFLQDSYHKRTSGVSVKRFTYTDIYAQFTEKAIAAREMGLVSPDPRENINSQEQEWEAERRARFQA